MNPDKPMPKKTHENPNLASARPSGSASDLPGRIRREIERMKIEDKRIGHLNADPECQEAVAWHRWAKRLKGEELSYTILAIMTHCVRERTCLAAKLAEAA